MDFQATLFGEPSSTAASPSGLAGIERTPLTRGAWVDVRRNWLPDADEVFAALVSHVPWRAERRQMYDRVVDVPRLVHTYAAGEPLPHPSLVAAREVLSEHYLPELGEPFVSAGCCYYRDGRDSVAWHGDTIGRGRTQDTMVAIVSLGDPRRLALRPKREPASVGDPTVGSEGAGELRGRHPAQRPKREPASAGDPTVGSEGASELRGRRPAQRPKREPASAGDPTAGREGADERRGRQRADPRGGGQSLSFELGHGDLLVMGGSCQRTWEHAVPKVAHAGPRISVQFRPLNVF